VEIDTGLAQNIVSALKEILNYEINFIAIDGRIIASTDQVRVGTFHEGGRLVKVTGQDLTVRSEDNYAGTYEGFNTAVYFNKLIVGIVGITGPTNEVTKFAKVIRKLTELMISEAHLVNLDYSNRQHQRNILEMLVSENFDMATVNFGLVDYDVSVNRRCVYASFVPVNSDDMDLYHILKKNFSSKQNLIVVQETFIVMFLENQEKDLLVDRLMAVQNELVSNFRMKLNFGLGDICDDVASARASFLQAKYAYQWAVKKTAVTIQFYDEFTLELLFAEGNHKQLETFSQRILGKLTDKEKNEFRQILTIYEKHNGSIIKTADELFIHKNTLQYRLNKLYDLTGYNPRELSDFVTLKLAYMSEEVYLK